MSSKCLMSGWVEQIFEQIQRRRVEPLQIVEEQRERVLRARKDADEPPHHRLEAALRVLRRQLGDRRLLADDEFQLGDQVDDQAPVRPERLAKRIRASAWSSASFLPRICRTRP